MNITNVSVGQFRNSDPGLPKLRNDAMSWTRGVAQLASSWVRSTRNLKPIANKQTSSISIERRPEVSSACGPRLEASRATLPATGRKGVGVDERAGTRSRPVRDVETGASALWLMSVP